MTTNETTIETKKHPQRVLKVNTCPSLSGRSTLTYQLGCNGESEPILRVSANSGRGYFTKEWVPFADIEALLTADAPLTFSTLQPIFEGRSVNTGGFLMAVLKNLNVITPVADNPRVHQRGDVDSFLAEVQALMASDVSLRKDAKPDGAKGKRKTISLPKTIAV